MDKVYTSMHCNVAYTFQILSQRAKGWCTVHMILIERVDQSPEHYNPDKHGEGHYMGTTYTARLRKDKHQGSFLTVYKCKDEQWYARERDTVLRNWWLCDRDLCKRLFNYTNYCGEN